MAVSSRLLRILLTLVLAGGVLYAVDRWAGRSTPSREASSHEVPSHVPTPRAPEPRSTTIHTAIGPVLAAKRDLTRLPRSALAAFVRLAREADLSASESRPWRLREESACGWFLGDEADELRILATAVLRRAPTGKRDDRSERRAVARAAARVAAQLPEDLDPGTRVALGNVLGLLSLSDRNPDDASLNPGYARLILAEGWLARVAAATPVAVRAALEEALAAAMKQRPQARWVGEGHALARVADAWGRGGEVLRTPDRTVLVLAPPLPMDDGRRHAAVASCETVLELPPGADPVADPGVAAQALRMALKHGDTELVTWSRAQGMRTDLAAWRDVFPESGGNVAPDDFPPHALITGLDRSLHGLIVSAGILRPVADGSEAEGERFLSDAARLLPDAVHLDLLQQYFMKWVYDSPDPTQPLAIGCEEANGDIHQTALQILGTTAGGIARGDCDDFAELTWDLARRQGRRAHVLSVPHHLAATWAEPQDDGWSVFVLQTGPVLRFRDESLVRALVRTYAWYDDTDPVDPDALSVSVRFQGESMRGGYALSWRIFAEPDYAAALLGVQECWHDNTLLQGIRTMRRLIDAGDDDPANHAEIGALYAGTGQYDEAVAAHREASGHARDREGRILRLVDVFHDLLAGGRVKEAVSLADELTGHELPEVVSSWGLRTTQVHLDLARSLASQGAPGPAARLLAATLRRSPRKIAPALEALADPRILSRPWMLSSSPRTLRDLLRECARASLAVLEHADATKTASQEDLRRIEAYLKAWLENVAFTDLEDRNEVLLAWAAYGRCLELREPEGFLERLEAAPFPVSSESDTHEALARTPADPAVLSWVRTSPYTATSRLGRLVAQRARPPDPDRVRRWGALLEESVAAAQRLGFDVAQANRTVHAARLQVALLTGQEEALRRLFEKARRLGDTRLRGTTVTALGHVAPHLDPVTWRKAVGCWFAEIDYPPNYYLLAWSAARAGAPSHALVVADLAAARRPSDAAFVEEAAWMHDLLGE